MVSTQAKRVLITGAAGGLGHRLCHMLVRHQLQVRGLVHPDNDTARLENRVEDLLVGDIQDPETVRRAMEGIDVVIHCAGLLPDSPGASRDDFLKVNVEGTRNVMREAILRQTKWVIAMSTISVVDHITRIVTPSELLEYVPPPHDPYLASKIEAEMLLRDMRRGFGGNLAILRLAYVYGPGNFAVWRRPLQFVEQGKLRLIGDGMAPLPLIYADDVGRFILTLLEAPTAGGCDGIHVLANPQSTTVRSVFDFVADYLHVRRPHAVPLWAARLGAALVGFLPSRYRWGRFEMLTQARVLQFSRGYNLTAVLDRQLLDRVGLTDYQEGLRHMLADYVSGRHRAAS